ncbi:MAG: phosphonate metabolism protein/1,5-bisphosphokinase (PRPP-forming) PhnN [Mesorhizobium amorphae]|nr:MAG: phosphonate metabolism protein/1,5-bisphosphokinase (PRPP-forming) PhnN [Mesorhizobium amorphae]
MSGTFVCVVGPSGAGKDTLIAGARAALAGDRRFTFPRRVVTRDASDAEDHDTVSVENFGLMEAKGEFALSWGAHGLRYAIPGVVASDLAGHRVAVCNLSRRAVADAKKRFEHVRVVLVTAPREVLRARILARGREDGADLDRRLDREAGTHTDADLTITNTGPVASHVAGFTRFLQDLAEEDAGAAGFPLGRAS